MTAAQLARWKRRSRARSRHRARYWRDNEREDYCCPDCGRAESHPDVDRLEVHHLDGNPLNPGENGSNLVGLCRACHYRRHGKRPPEDLEDWKEKVRSLGDGESESIGDMLIYADSDISGPPGVRGGP